MVDILQEAHKALLRPHTNLEIFHEVFIVLFQEPNMQLIPQIPSNDKNLPKFILKAQNL
jgi:hypothetical protein